MFKQHWSRVHSGAFTIGPRSAMTGLAVLGDGRIVAVGQSGPKADSDAAVWESRVKE